MRGAQLPNADPLAVRRGPGAPGATPRRVEPEPPPPATTARAPEPTRSADAVYSFLSSFTAGVQRGLDEARPDDPGA